MLINLAIAMDACTSAFARLLAKDGYCLGRNCCGRMLLLGSASSGHMPARAPVRAQEAGRPEVRGQET
ncbi:MAG: hypothetical protein NTY37_06470 [Methanothrix sp.]|nr:hypothetical protein [Methanothrix sp.]